MSSKKPVFVKQRFFEYNALAKGSSTIRLIELEPGDAGSPIRCQLRDHDLLLETTSYEALSYEWGELKEREWIWVNDCRFYIQPNLQHALHALRARKSLRVWIDAICIDQSNNEERAHQVNMMADIYRNASCVIAWIGPSTDDEEPAFDYLANPKRLEPSDEEFRALLELACNSYWHRAWIRPELLLAKRIVVACGSSEIQWEVLAPKYLFALAASESSEDRDCDLYYVQDDLECICNERLEMRKHSDDLATLIGRYGNADCAEPRDRVFSLLSLVPDCLGPRSFYPDYDIPSELLFFALLSVCTPENYVHFGRVLGDALEVHVDEINRLVWQPDLMDRDVIKASPASQMAFVFFDKLQQDLDDTFQCFQNGIPLDVGAWSRFLQFCIRTANHGDDTKHIHPETYYILQVGHLDLVLVFRLAIAGYYLIGLARQDERSASLAWTLFDPLEDYKAFLDSESERIETHMEVANTVVDMWRSKRNFVQLVPHKLEAKVRISIEPDLAAGLPVELISIVLSKLNKSGDYRLDPRPCMALLQDIYKIKLAVPSNHPMREILRHSRKVFRKAME